MEDAMLRGSEARQDLGRTSKETSSSRSSGGTTKRDSSKHYFQGGYDYDFVDGLDKRFECPICLLCQRDPYQTSCGHRFCYTCILTWLSEGRTCPDDNCSLGEGDIFPDTIFHREILQLPVRCPNARDPKVACKAVIPLADVEIHQSQCQASSIGGRGRSGDGAEKDPGQGSSRPAGGGAAPAGQTAGATSDESFTCPSCGELLDLDPKLAPSGGLLRSKDGRHNLICPNVEVACPLASAGCSEKVPRALLADHIQTAMPKHIQILWECILKLKQTDRAMGNSSLDEESGNPAALVAAAGAGALASRSGSSSPVAIGRRDDALRMSGSNLHSTQQHLKDLFRRVVVLEQKNRQLEILNQNLKVQLRELKPSGFARRPEAEDERRWETVGRACNGRFVWKIPGFSGFLEKMRHNHAFVLYSRGFYTSPFGYKLCLRCNVHIIGGEEILGLFIHLMRGDNDDILPWPFSGKVIISMRKRTKSSTGGSATPSGSPESEDFFETIVTPHPVAGEAPLSALRRPLPHEVAGCGSVETSGRNPVGYGIQQFIRVNSLYSMGFLGHPEVGGGGVEDDTLAFRVHVISSD